MKLLIIAFGVSATIANLAGRGYVGPPPDTAAATAAPHAGDDCRGGEEDAVTVKLEPGRIDGGRMAIDVHVHQHFEDAANVVGAVEVIDDRGRRIGTIGELAPRPVPARSATAYSIETPGALADGYYRVQVSLLARVNRAAGDEDFSTHQLYFHIAGGSVTPVTSEEWLTRSQSGLAFSSP
jgi:hypothetical protein